VTTWELIAEKARELPPEKQLEVLDFLEFLRTRGAPRDVDNFPQSPWGLSRKSGPTSRIRSWR